MTGVYEERLTEPADGRLKVSFAVPGGDPNAYAMDLADLRRSHRLVALHDPEKAHPLLPPLDPNRPRRTAP